MNLTARSHSTSSYSPSSSYSRSTSYSRYADLPADRDLERVSAELLALPTPTVASTAAGAHQPWLRRHLHLHRLHA